MKRRIKIILIAMLIMQIVFPFAFDFCVHANDVIENENIVKAIVTDNTDKSNSNKDEVDMFIDEDEDNYENYSEEYKNYLKLSDEQKAEIGALPRKYDISIEEFEKKYAKDDNTQYIDEKTLNEVKKNSVFKSALDMANVDSETTIPSSYDMRNDITINVENQYKGTCWAFASLGTVRTYLAKHGYNNKVTPNLSERHLDYLTSKYYSKGSGRELNSGGSFSYALKYFKYNDGPILESRFPNTTEIDVTNSSELERIDNFSPNYYVHETISFPSITKVRQSDGTIKIYNGSNEITESALTTIRNKIKKQVKNNGGVYCSLRCHDNFYFTNSGGKEGWYDDGTLTDEIASANNTEIGGHGMVIVGWNDNYSKENFKTKNANGVTVQPKHDGAYLVLNSWGSDYNGDGYLWISYDDYGIERSVDGIVSADTTETKYTYTFQNETAYNKMKTLFTSQKGEVITNDSTKTIKVLDLVFNDMTYISSLEIKNAGLTDNDLKTIFKYELPWVRNLNLSGNSITDVSLIDCSDIEYLCLNNNNIESINDLYQYRSELKELYLNDNQISDCGVLSQLTGLNKLYLNNNKIEEVTPLGFLSLDEFYIKNQSISKILNNTLDYSYPTIIQKTKSSSSNMYSSSGLEFVNCKENSASTGVKVTDGSASSIYIKVKSGIASGTTINLKINDTVPPNLTVTGNPTNWVKNATLTITASDSVSGLKAVTVNGNGVTMSNGVGKYLVSENGRYMVVAYDYKNNPKAVTIDINTIDKVQPTLTITGNPSSWTKETTLTIKAEDGDSGIKSVTVNGTAITLNSNGQGTYKVTQNGIYEIIAADNAGNTKEQTVTVNKIDKVQPTITVTGNPSSWTKEATLTIKAEDGDSGIKSVTVNGTAITLNNEGQGTYKVTQNGTYKIVATDNVGLTKEQTITVNKIDNTQPTLTVTGNPSSWTKETTLTIKAEDGDSGIKSVTVNGTAITLNSNGQGTYKVTQNGIYEIIAADNAGNTKEQTVTVNKIDKVQPTITVTGNPSSWTKEATLTIKAEDGDSGVKNVTVNGTAITLNSNGQGTYKVTKNDTYEIVAIDNVGNSITKTITVDKIIGKIGDINKDSKINIADVIAVIRHIGSKEGSKYYLDEEERAIADVNDDGKINIADVIGIMRLISSNSK